MAALLTGLWHLRMCGASRFPEELSQNQPPGSWRRRTAFAASESPRCKAANSHFPPPLRWRNSRCARYDRPQWSWLRNCAAPELNDRFGNHWATGRSAAMGRGCRLASSRPNGSDQANILNNGARDRTRKAQYRKSDTASQSLIFRCLTGVVPSSGNPIVPVAYGAIHSGTADWVRYLRSGHSIDRTISIELAPIFQNALWKSIETDLPALDRWALDGFPE